MESSFWKNGKKKDTIRISKKDGYRKRLLKQRTGGAKGDRQFGNVEKNR